MFKPIQNDLAGLWDYLYPIEAGIACVLFVTAGVFFLYSQLDRYKTAKMGFRLVMACIALCSVWKGMAIPLFHVTVYGTDFVLSVSLAFASLYIVLGGPFGNKQLGPGVYANTPKKKKKEPDRLSVLASLVTRSIK